MSQENVDLVRRAWEAATGGDLQPALDMMALDVEVDLTTGGRMDGDIHRGPAGLRLAYEIWATSWDSMVMEAREFIDVREDQLIVRIFASGRAKQTGLAFEGEYYWVYAMRDARVVRIQEFRTRQEALIAVGLAE